MTGKNHSTCYTFKQFNEEMNDFYKYLKDNKFSDAEIRKIFSPLNRQKITYKLVSCFFLIFLLTVTILYISTHVESISWHLSALGRIFLIKLVPFWDWTLLKNEKCLISKPASSTIPEITFNCDLCENIVQIDVYNDIAEDILKTRYLDLNVPLIIKQASKSWPKSKDFIDNLLNNKKVAQSTPCDLATNIHNGPTTFKNLMLRTDMFANFFIHFRNCDFAVVKEFRSFTPRPYYLPAELSPIQSNWLLWSKNYNITHFKPINLVERIALVGQIVGSNFVNLLPRSNCEVKCPQINVKLNQGEAVIFTSLWNMEYKPDEGENIAVVLEMH